MSDQNDRDNRIKSKRRRERERERGGLMKGEGERGRANKRR